MLSVAQEKRVLLVLVLLAVVVGIIGREAHLGRKLFWQDEAITALRVSGHDLAEFKGVFDNRVHPVGEILAYTDRDPRTNVGTVIRTLADEEPQHPPLFYVLDRLALDARGTDEPSTYRLPSLLFGILAIGFAYLFGAMLYRSKTGGGILAALVALSPLHVLYSRQAREYSMFTCAVFASSYFLLRALDARKAIAWVPYALTVMLALYTDPIFGLVLAAQAIFVFVTARSDRGTIVSYVVATALGVVSFAPWALKGIYFSSTADVGKQLDWGNNAFPLKFFAEKWGFNTAAVFFDGEFGDPRLTVIAVAVLAIVLVAIVQTFRTSDLRSRTFALSLTILPLAAFLAYDFKHGSHFSTIPRYLMAGWIGLEVIVAGALWTGIAARARWAFPAFIFLIGAGCISAPIDNGAENWWDNNNQVNYQEIARTIDATPKPLVINEGFMEVPLLFARYLRPDASLLLLKGSTIPELPAGAEHVFLLIPSERLLDTVRSREPNAAVANLSPAPPTIIADFHSQLRHDKDFKPLESTQNERPDNALWALTVR